MADEPKIETTETEATDKTRREFVKKSAQVAVTAPAVAMLLSATTKPASAQISLYEASQKHILDDFTSGNDHEDVDALETHSNVRETGGDDAGSNNTNFDLRAEVDDTFTG